MAKVDSLKALSLRSEDPTGPIDFPWKDFPFEKRAAIAS